MVTGGAGYIGSHTCKALAHQGHTVVTYDNLSTGHRELVRWGNFVYGDILDTQRLRSCIRQHRVEGIIHFAASAYVGESVVNPGKYFKNNVRGTLSLLNAMRDEGVEHIVVSSTCAVYGACDGMPITESTPTNPINPYGASKLFMERMLADYEKAHGLRWMALRYFNAAGCDPDGETGEWHDPEPHLIPRAIMAATGQIPNLEIFGNDYSTPDGTCIRDYVHVTDLAKAHVSGIKFLIDSGSSQILNLGAGDGTSVQKIISTIKNITGKDIRCIISPRRDGDPAILKSDSSKARKILNWSSHNSNLICNIETSFKWLNQNKLKFSSIKSSQNSLIKK